MGDPFQDAIRAARSLQEINVELTSVVIKREHFERLKAYATAKGYIPFHTESTENTILGIKLIIED